MNKRYKLVVLIMLILASSGSEAGWLASKISSNRTASVAVAGAVAGAGYLLHKLYKINQSFSMPRSIPGITELCSYRAAMRQLHIDGADQIIWELGKGSCLLIGTISGHKDGSFCLKQRLANGEIVIILVFEEIKMISYDTICYGDKYNCLRVNYRQSDYLSGETWVRPSFVDIYKQNNDGLLEFVARPGVHLPARDYAR